MKYSAKVFVVDDNPDVRASLEAILTAQGYSVRSFPSAKHFLAHHHPTQVGCVLINLSMSGMGGRQLLKRLQESKSLLSVVIISGLVDSTTPRVNGAGVLPLLIEVLGEEAKAEVPLVIKPYEVTTLLTMVEDGIAGSVRRRAKKLRDRPPGNQPSQ